MLYVSRAHSYYGFQWKTQAGRAHTGLFDNNDRYSEAELVLIVVFRVGFFYFIKSSVQQQQQQPLCAGQGVSHVRAESDETNFSHHLLFFGSFSFPPCFVLLMIVLFVPGRGSTESCHCLPRSWRTSLTPWIPAATVTSHWRHSPPVSVGVPSVAGPRFPSATSNLFPQTSATT